jgi:hypothetical protein
MSLFSKKKSLVELSSSVESSYQSPFGKNFRRGYKNAWIDSIKDYKP